MCVNYRPPTAEQFGTLGAFSDLPADWRWPEETWKDYLAPIVRRGEHGRPVVSLATYGMVPRRRIPPEIKPFDTMNARAESLAERRSFAPSWRRLQLCAVPTAWFHEPCYESGRAVRHAIGMRDESLFFVAGLWRDWAEEDGSVSSSFTQITINADDHPLMRRMHKPDDEKRSLVILPREDVADWLACGDMEVARSFLRHYPAERMRDWVAAPAPKKKVDVSPNLELF